MGQEPVELGHREVSITGVEENTLITLGLRDLIVVHCCPLLFLPDQEDVGGEDGSGGRRAWTRRGVYNGCGREYSHR